MKFDFVIGNPPYQDTSIGENKTFMPPIYNVFLDTAYDIGDKVELIHPARFLFNAGSTPKDWNEKMLHDEHLKVLYYAEDSSEIFPGLTTPIKGGIAITYHDITTNFGKIEVFTPSQTLNSILSKVNNQSNASFSDIVITRTAYRLTNKMHTDYPNAIKQLSDGHAYDMASNIFYRLPEIFYDNKPSDGYEYIRILGRIDNNRIYKYVRKDYVNSPENLYKYKLFLSGANGNGTYGEMLTKPVFAEPGEGCTETFISIGSFSSKIETTAVMKYIYTKFARSLLGILKKTQANTPEKWKFVPLQDFSSKSDIDWTCSVHEIDRQLYKKYGLTDEEKEFIETHVKEMK